MALDFSKINGKIVGYKIPSVQKTEKIFTLVTFKDFIDNLLVNIGPQTYSGCCNSLEQDLKDYEMVITAVRECYRDGSAAERINIFSPEIIKINNSLRLIRENYGLEILVEAGLLPKHFL